MAKVFLRGKVKHWDDLEVGSLFCVELGGEMCVGFRALAEIKLGEAVDRCVMLTPGRSHGKPHAWDHEALGSRPLLQLDDAMLVPGDFDVTYSELPEAGDLVQTPEGPMLIVLKTDDHGRTGLPCVNLSTGKYLSHRPQEKFIAFKGWKIVLPSRAENEPETTILEWPPKAKAAA